MNFIRTANGKKLYVKDALKDRPSLESQSTKLMKARQKTLYRGFNGQPLHKVNNIQDFKPASKSQAKKMLQSASGGVYEDEYDNKRNKEL